LPPPFKKRAAMPLPEPPAPEPPKPEPPAPAAIAEPVPPAPVDIAPAPAPAPLRPPALDRRLVLAVGALALLAFIGLGFALSGGDEEASPRPVAKTVAPEADAEADAEVADQVEVAAEAELAPVAEAEPAPPEKARPAKKRKATRTARAEPRPAPRAEPQPKRTERPRMVRLSLRSSPPGATFRVNGETLNASNETMVPSGSTATVTAVLRGYKRVTRQLQVRKGASLVIDLERM
jgi:hypothetical protein